MHITLWKMIMKHKSALFVSILAGMSSSANIYADTKYPDLDGSDMERLRNDVSRVGKDFNNVISRENGKTKTTRTSKHAA